jgi:hypothetical protein
MAGRRRHRPRADRSWCDRGRDLALAAALSCVLGFCFRAIRDSLTNRTVRSLTLDKAILIHWRCRRLEQTMVFTLCSGSRPRVPRSRDGLDVWLAVTSLSFDISVLELFWILSRSIKVVIQSDRRDTPSRGKARRLASIRLTLRKLRSPA